MRLRMVITAIATVIASLVTLTACGNTSAKGIVAEKHNPRNGINVSRGGCKKTEWLLVIDQGISVPKNKRIVNVCVSEETAKKYNLLAKYP